ncbi:MAG: hypothetical protein JWN14_48, partial [Chthonomonadales bacterium]|nr:hypothetical protein [Chthonomonadales bacterium]
MSALETPINAAAADADVKLVPGKEFKLPTAVFAIDAHPAGKRIFAACFDGNVFEISTESGERKLLGKHTSFASGVRYLPKADRVVSAGYDGALLWMNPAETKPLRTVVAHKFWSWKMRVSPDEQFVGTVTGQYAPGDIKYTPAAEVEPSIKVFEAATGKLRWSFPHVPPTLSVAFSPDSRYIAAGNLMGEVRVYDLQTGKQAAAWTTPDFTCWGIIKSHHYIGGIYDMTFNGDGKELLVCGMGPMVDPMSGNGKQTWQRFAWQEKTPRKISEIREGDAGGGLMEVLRFHPDQKTFLMSGRLAVGKWNTAIFDASSGHTLHTADTKMRVTDAAWLHDGTQLALSGMTGQGKKTKEGKYPEFGHIKLYDF